MSNLIFITPATLVISCNTTLKKAHRNLLFSVKIKTKFAEQLLDLEITL